MPALEIKTLYAASALQAEVDFCKRNATYASRITDLEAKIDQLQTQHNLRDARVRVMQQSAEEKVFVDEMEVKISDLEIQIKRLIGS